MPKQADPVVFTEETLRELQAVYDLAVATSQDVFTYRGRDYSTRYTYYLLKYLREKFAPPKKERR